MLGFSPNFILVDVLTLVGAATTGYGIFQRRATRLSRRARRRWERKLLSWGIFSPSNEPPPEVMEGLALDLTHTEARVFIYIGGGTLVGGIVAGAVLFSIRDTALAQSLLAELLLPAVMALGLLAGSIAMLLGSGMRVVPRAEARNRRRGFRRWWPLAWSAGMVVLYSALTLAVSLGPLTSASPYSSTLFDPLDPYSSPWLLWVIPIAAALVLAVSELALYLMSRTYPTRSTDTDVAQLAAERSCDERMHVFVLMECYCPPLILVSQTEMLAPDFSSFLKIGLIILPTVGTFISMAVLLNAQSEMMSRQSAPL